MVLLVSVLAAGGLHNQRLPGGEEAFHGVTIPMMFGMSHIGPTPAPTGSTGWYLEITNKGNASDYPGAVTGGKGYVVNMTLNLTVPPGESGSLQFAYGFFHVDPESFRAVTFSNMTQPDVEVGPGTQSLTQSLRFDTPVVHRESFSRLTIAAEIVSGSFQSTGDSIDYKVKVRPEDPAVDVAFRGTVVSRFTSFGFLSSVSTMVDEVLTDPTGLLRPGRFLFVLSDTERWEPALPLNTTIRDIVEVRGDYHPKEDPYVGAWKASHRVLRIGTRNHAPTLVAPSVDPTNGYDLTTYIFSVRYADADGDSPKVFLILDGGLIPMEYIGGENGTEAVFRHAQRLAPGLHTFGFLANDTIGAPNSLVTTAMVQLNVGSFTTALLIASAAVGAPAAVASYVLLKRWRAR